MKNLRKLISVIITVTMLAGICSVSASALVFSDGKFNYTLNSVAKTATIIEYIGSSANVEIPLEYNGYAVTKIDDMAFQGKEFIEEIKIPSTVETIENYAFSNCTGLKAIFVPESVKSLGIAVFSGCTALESADINASVDKISDDTFYNCTSLSDVKLSSSVVELGNSAFYNCTSLEYLNELENMNKIGQLTFYNCGLINASIGENLEEIPRLSFAGCDNLVKVVIPSAITNISDSAFDESDVVTIYGYIDTYAEEYANTYDIPFFAMDKWSLGDINLDGVVDVNDVTYLQRHIAKYFDLTDEAKWVADINGDGIINVFDVTKLQWVLVGI